jgi:predicted dehydrogenase
MNRRGFHGRLGGIVLAEFLGSRGTILAHEQPAKPIKIGQIGVGHAHAGKLSVYRNSRDYEVVGVAEPDETLRTQAEKTQAFRGVKWLTREQLLDVRDLQVVLVETQVRDLLDNAQAFIDAGISVQVDKPAGESLSKFKRLLNEAARKKLIVQMGYMFRYNPAVVMLRDFLKQGWLGDVFEVHAVMSKVVDPPDRRRFAEYPGGMMFELGCHVMDLVIAILGKPTKVSSVRQHASATGDKLLDNMLAVLEYPRAIASVKSTALEVEGFDRRHLVVCGTEGTFHIQPLDNPAARISLSKDRGSFKKGTQDVKFPKYVRYVDDAADMARVLRGQQAPLFTSDHDLIVQETLLRACGLLLSK